MDVVTDRTAGIDGAVRTGRALAEAAAAVLPLRWVRADFPLTAADVDPGFLTRALRDVAGGATVVAARPVGGTSGTTDRVRLDLSWDRDSGDLPRHVFIKSTPTSAKNRTMVAALALARNEALFYRHARSALSERSAPRCFSAHAGMGARHLLVLEDLTDRGGEPKALCDDVDAGYARAMMVTLGELHATFWDSPRLRGDLDFVRPERERPGFPLLLRQFRQVRSKLLKSAEYELPREVREMAAFVNANDWALHANWDKGPQTVIHGDTHLGNTFGLGDGGVGLLDWQVLYRAPGMRDVAYFLVTSVPVEVRRAHTDELLQTYLETLARNGVPAVPTRDQAWDALCLFAFDAWDSAAITLVWPGLQAPENVAKSVERANAAIVDLDVMPVLRRSI
ncbi:Ecdysteroid kinase [Mycolicibacterium rutilum]|uniref:Ecdysteroid kinase n=1 Tax=Mycolicibacterium rutilum TaxID=370526 RepID=A0A1H6J3M6_MYCRU|nr:ecdysteroid 22-kinase family protein [Mycolicibacterium rutilum]SEH53541.1 Ecdysteroid kinase [Mycolicibacterium rutilum]